MTLTLRALSLNGVPLTQPIKARFEAEGGTIGRADHNTLALPDPERIISREQASIRAHGAGWVIRNISSANPILVRNQLVERGESAALQARDQVMIGGYLLEVIEAPRSADDDLTVVPASRAAAAPAASPHQPLPTRPRPAPLHAVPAAPAERPRPAPRAANGAAIAASGVALNSFGPLSRDNPFSALLDDDAPHGGPRPVFEATAHATQPAATLPADFDPFAPRTVQPAPAAARTSSAADGASIGDLIGDADALSIDDLIAPRCDEHGDPMDGFIAEPPAARQRAAPADGADTVPPRPDAAFARTLQSFEPAGARTSVPAAQTTPDRTPEWRAAFKPPAPLRAVPAAPAPARAPAPSLRAPPAAAQAPLATAPEPARAPDEAGADAEGLWAAFRAGAGVELHASQGLTPERMHEIGALLRAAVEGTLRLVAMRQETRKEMGADITVIHARGNNPLKFSPDAQSALEQLLRPPARGFVPATTAMNDVMDDLLGHAIGTMAGTRAALEGVLSRFAPDDLEAQLSRRSVLDTMLRLHRKSRLWDLYLQHYGAIRESAQGDFHALFGKAFLAAYEQQLDALHRERNPTPE